MGAITLVLAIALVAVVGMALLLALRLRQPPPQPDLTPLQALLQMLQQQQSHLTALSERVTRVEGTAQGLSQTAESIRTLTQGLQAGLSELRGQAQARLEEERRTGEAIRRLEAVIAGVQSRGSAGENILEEILTHLPPEWQVKNHRVGGKVVEFAVRLPGNRLLPVDSKWPAPALLERLANATDPEERRRLKAQVERQVKERVEEVRKYIDPAVTVNFALAVVPDAVYDLCTGILPEVVRNNVVVVSYRLFLPYLLLVFNMALSTATTLDLERLASFLQEAERAIDSLQKELDGRFSRALTMLDNSYAEITHYLGRLRTGLAGVQALSLPQWEEGPGQKSLP